MTNQTSRLVVRLKDDVSGPAGRAARSLRSLKNEARGTAAINVMPRADGVGAIAASAGRVAVGMAGAALSIYAVGRGLRSAYTEAATFDRRMTRIGITADASGEAINSATRQVEAIAREVALPVNDVVDGLDALTASGKTLEESLALLPSVARTAQASGAAVNDIARSAQSVGEQFKVSASEMQLAFDMMAKSGKLGQFELKDMAAEFPSLAARAAALGFKGTKGLATLTTALQMVRRNTGTAGEAATAFGDVLGKMESNDTLKNFRKHFGIDLERSFKKARKEGGNLFEVLEEALVKITEKDLSNVNKVFTDKEARTGALAIAQYARERRRLQEQVERESGGTVMVDVARVTKDAQASVENLTNAWNGLSRSVGRGLDAAGVSSSINSISGQLDSLIDTVERGDSLFHRLQRRMQGYQLEQGGKNVEFGEDLKAQWNWLSENVVPHLPVVMGYNALSEWAGATGDEAEQKGREAAIRDRLAEEEKILKRYADLQAERAKLTAPEANVPNHMLDANERRLAAVKTQAMEIALRRHVEGLRINQTSGNTKPVLGGGATFGFGVGGTPDDTENRWGADPTAPLPPVRPSTDTVNPTAPVQPIRPAVDTTDLEAAKGKASEAGQAIQSLDMTVAPTVDVSSIRTAQAEVKALLADLARVGPAAQNAAKQVHAASSIQAPQRSNPASASQQTASRDLGRQFESRRRATFADNEFA
jgi:TP901 family phage tail tape measure protein